MATKQNYDFLHPGVSESTYNSFSMDEKNLFDLITSRGGGVRGVEIKKQLGLGFERQRQLINTLRGKGVRITELTVGYDRRYYYSPYAEDKQKWINGGMEK